MAWPRGLLGMRVAVTGGRHYADRAAVWAALDAVERKHPGFMLVHGDCPTGADAHAAAWAEATQHPVEAFPAAWERLGRRRAGPIRNQAMVDSGLDGCVAFPGGTGTSHMVGCCRRAGVPVWRPAKR